MTDSVGPMAETVAVISAAPRLYRYLKHALDFALALLAVVVLSPLMLALAAWIKLTSKGPVLYRGVRAGRNGVPFRMLKYRTMVVDAEKIGAASTSADDARITMAGHVLRRFKL